MIKFENKNNGRFYYVYVEKDLLHHFALAIHYGGVHVRRNRRIAFDDERSLRKEIERITKKRLKRGYSLVT